VAERHLFSWSEGNEAAAPFLATRLIL
jgi:hypothetical protein